VHNPVDCSGIHTHVWTLRLPAMQASKYLGTD
jgi:hypothetical protein